jgi:hypothetical protein
MSIGDRIGIGRGGPGWRWPRVRLHRPTGIRNGGLLLILVALAAVLALVDQPPQPGTGRRLPGIFQYLPPPVGITLTPPVTDPPLPAAGPMAGPAADGERPASADRAHPRRAHPRPAAASSGASGSSGSRGSDLVTEPVGDPGGSGGSGGSGSGGSAPPVAQPPVATPPVATPAVRVRVPSVSARVKPPAVLGRDLPEVRVKTPEATVEVPAGLTALP